MPLGTEVSLGPGNIVLHGDRAPPKKGHSSPHFLAHVYSGQTVQWIKMPLGKVVDLGPGHTLLHGDPSPPERVLRLAKWPGFPGARVFQNPGFNPYVNVIAKYYMTERSSAVLLTHTVKPDANDVIFKARFM